MIGIRALLLSVAIATTICSAQAAGQTPTDLVEQGVRAYGELEYDAAAASLRRALRGTPGVNIEVRDYARALIYLAATQYYQGDPDSTEALFEQLVLLDTRERPDPLVFEPGVTDIFEAVRRETKALTVVVPEQTEFRVGRGSVPITLYASSFIGTVVEVFDRDSSLVRLVYDGPVNDSLVVTWDGADSTDTPLANGRYTLAVTSRRPGGVSLRSTRFSVNLRASRRDTLEHPLPLADSIFLPERATAKQGLQALFGGLLTGGAVMLLPNVLASDAELAGARYAVGSALSLAGIVGFVSRKPGRIFPENVAANNELREEWNGQLNDIISENSDRIADVRLMIEVGPPRVVELRRR